MTNTNITRTIRKICTFLLLLAVIMQITTVILIETGFSIFDIGEVHEICGFTIIGLVLVHVIIFRKSLKSILTSKSK